MLHQWGRLASNGVITASRNVGTLASRFAAGACRPADMARGLSNARWRLGEPQQPVVKVGIRGSI